MNGRYIKSEVIDGVFLLKMHDPATRNALNDDMVIEFDHELSRFESTPELKILVLTGTDPSFCSGANVRQMSAENNQASCRTNPEDRSPWDLLQESWDKQAAEARRPEDLIEGIRSLPLKLHNLQKPSIAAINGPAIGLGMGLALSCDIRFASEKASFAEMFVHRGLIPADGSCWQLPRMIGISNTLMLQYTGDKLNAHQAEKMGIVNKITAHNELISDTLNFAQRLAKGATFSMSLTKKLVYHSLQTTLAESLMLAGPAQQIARRTKDHKEGVKAFIEKRTPKFKGG